MTAQPPPDDKRPPPGVYTGKDGKQYRVFSDGSTFEILPRTIRVNGQKVKVPGTYKRIGTTRVKEKADAVDTQGRHPPYEESQIRQIEAAVERCIQLNSQTHRR